ncbi:MAG TPA: MerR family transcriptional regulator, partial [Minicystis sp.]|nr:MerR family transcriptional regulator [Minicystis sp.]
MTRSKIHLLDEEMSPDPPNSYDLETLARLARVSPSTIRMYVHTGVLPRAVLRGRNTRYDDGYLARLRAVRHLLHVERLSLDQIRVKLSRMSDAQVLALL